VTVDILEETLARLFSEKLAPEARRDAEDEGWDESLWESLSELGMPWVSISEKIGGPGGELLDAAVLLRQAGAHAVPLPLAETSMLGGWLLEQAGLTLPDGPLTVPVPKQGDTLTIRRDGNGWTVTGALGRVPWASRAVTLVAVADDGGSGHVIVVDPVAAEIEPGWNIAGEPRDAVQLIEVGLPDNRVAAVPSATSDELVLRGALSRTLLMSGAMESVAEMTRLYARERVQFGRAIISFQAVAHRLARLAEEVAAASLAADVAARAFAERGLGARFEIAAAKSAASRAATEVAAHAHQIHGAIGLTHEYLLHYYTRRLWSWRQEWGSERRWNTELGSEILAAGDAQLWPRVCSGLVERE
jgi:acyl-CoA dehydrogenase